MCEDAAFAYLQKLHRNVTQYTRSGQVPANKTFKPDPRIPAIDAVRLIKYDFQKYGKAAERRRLIDRWEKDVNALPR